jgi:hypothetical protein
MMHLTVEITQEGVVYLPDEIMQILQPNTRFTVNVENGRLILSPVSLEQPFWATATPENEQNAGTSG